MFEECVAKYLAIGVETHEYLQIASEATGSALDGSAEVLALRILSLIDDKSHLLALGIVLPQGVGLHHREVVDTHHRLNAVSQRLRFLFGDRTFRQVVDVGQDATHDNSHEGEHQHHIQ